MAPGHPKPPVESTAFSVDSRAAGLKDPTALKAAYADEKNSLRKEAEAIFDKANEAYKEDVHVWLELVNAESRREYEFLFMRGAKPSEQKMIEGQTCLIWTFSPKHPLTKCVLKTRTAMMDVSRSFLDTVHLKSAFQNCLIQYCVENAPLKLPNKKHFDLRKSRFRYHSLFGIDSGNGKEELNFTVNHQGSKLQVQKISNLEYKRAPGFVVETLRISLCSAYWSWHW